MRVRSTVLAWWIWFFTVIAIIAGVMSLSGCATLPPCPRPNFDKVETDEGMLYVLDEDNIVILANLLEELHAGRCAPGRPKPKGDAA